jgi:hypothetical protein
MNTGNQHCAKPRKIEVTLNREGQHGYPVAVLAVDIDGDNGLQKEQPIYYKGTLYVHYADYLLSDAHHADEKIDWRARMSYVGVKRPLMLPDDAPLAKVKAVTEQAQ